MPSTNTDISANTLANLAYEHYLAKKAQIATLDEDCGVDPVEIRDIARAAVRSCDAIYLLKGWESSKGSKKELAEALANGLEVILEN